MKSGLVILLGIDVLGAGRNEGDRHGSVDVDARRLEAARARRVEIAGELAAQQVVVARGRDLPLERQPIRAGMRVEVRARRSQPFAGDRDLDRQPAISYLIDFKPHFSCTGAFRPPEAPLL